MAIQRFLTDERGALCLKRLKGIAYYPEAECAQPIQQEVLKTSLKTLAWWDAAKKGTGQLQVLWDWEDSEPLQNEEQSVTPKHRTELKTGETPGGFIVRIAYNAYTARTYYKDFKDGKTVRGFKISSDTRIIGEDGTDSTFLKELLFYVTATKVTGDSDAIQYIQLKFQDVEIYDTQIDSVKPDFDFSAMSRQVVKNIVIEPVTATGTSITFRALDAALENYDSLTTGAPGAAKLVIYDKTASAAVVATDLQYDSDTEIYTATVPALTVTNVLEISLDTPDNTDDYLHTPNVALITVS